MALDTIQEPSRYFIFDASGSWRSRNRWQVNVSNALDFDGNPIVSRVAIRFRGGYLQVDRVIIRGRCADLH